MSYPPYGSQEFNDFLDDLEAAQQSYYSSSNELTAAMIQNFSSNVSQDNDLGSKVGSSSENFSLFADWMYEPGQLSNIGTASSALLAGAGAISKDVAAGINFSNISNITTSIENSITGVDASTRAAIAGEIDEVGRALGKMAFPTALGFVMAEYASDPSFSTFGKELAKLAAGNAAAIGAGFALGLGGALTSAAGLAFLEGSVPYAAVAVLASPVTATVVGVGLAVAASYAIHENWDSIVDFIEQGYEIGSAQYDSLLSALNSVFDNVMDGLETVGNDIADAWSDFIGSIPTAFDNLGDFISDILDRFGAAISNGSPLVLDLDDSGTIDLISLANSQSYWDIDENGFRELSGWVDTVDGLLAIDLNENGQIDNNSELFGSVSTDEGITSLTDEAALVTSGNLIAA